MKIEANENKKWEFSRKMMPTAANRIYQQSHNELKDSSLVQRGTSLNRANISDKLETGRDYIFGYGSPCLSQPLAMVDQVIANFGLVPPSTSHQSQ